MRGNSVFRVHRSLDEISAETAALLHKAGVQLSLAESGTGGELADCLSATSAGRAVLTHSRIFGAAEELAAGLRVSSAKVDAFSALSAIVAAEAAAELIDTYEGGWGLAVMAPVGNLPSEPSVPSKGASDSAGFIALGTPSTTIVKQCPPYQIVETTLKLLQEQGLRRLKLR